MADNNFDSIVTNIFYKNKSNPSANATQSMINLYDTLSTHIKLVSQDSLSVVSFDSMPEIEESGSTIYASLDDIRAPASIMIYLGSPARSFNINHKFVSRTREEANKTFKNVSILRAWRMPRKALSGAEDATPETIKLYGYNKTFNAIPTVVQNLNISWPIDYDYIDSDFGPVPIITPVSISLKEIHSKNDLSAFDYNQYKSGNLPGWT